MKIKFFACDFLFYFGKFLRSHIHYSTYVCTFVCINLYLLSINSYITVGNQDHKRHLYYYFATSERNPLEDPMTIWINGGPACSGLSGLFQLVGKHYEALMPLELELWLFIMKIAISLPARSLSSKLIILHITNLFLGNFLVGSLNF